MTHFEAEWNIYKHTALNVQFFYVEIWQVIDLSADVFCIYYFFLWKTLFINEVNSVVYGVVERSL